MIPDPLTAVLNQLAEHTERIIRLDTREADHFSVVTGRLTELTNLITGIGQSLQNDTPALTRLEALDRQVTDLAAQLTGTGAHPDDYRPDPAPTWWKLAPADRQEPIARLQAWIEQVYEPGYGHLAATLGPCWPSHDLCLYGLDILAELWSVLYLQPSRNPGLISAQAESQARILPALADQLRVETHRCGHPRNPAPADGQPWSRP